MTPLRTLIQDLPFSFEKIAEIKTDKIIFNIDVMNNGGWRVAYSTAFKNALNGLEPTPTNTDGE